MVPKTNELLPEPDTPVNTVSRRLGMSRLTSLRLFTRAPCTRIMSWRSELRVSALLIVPPSGRGYRRSSGLRDADEVARRVAEGAVAGAPRLRHGLLEHFGTGRAEL